VKSSSQPPVAFVDFIQNHDQTGNRAQGERLISLAGAARTQVLLATLLVSPHIPLLFMGEEYGETQPFLFFTDFHGDLAKAVREGRAREFEGHAGHGETVPDPNDVATFEQSKLNWPKRETPEGQQWLALTRQLLSLRQQHVVPLLQTAGGDAGQVITTSEGFLAVRWDFPAGTLSLALNVSNRTQPIPDLPGKTLFAWPQAASELAPDSIVVRLAKGETA
jgi:1,4-alpha-glucan branching enzyme